MTNRKSRTPFRRNQYAGSCSGSKNVAVRSAKEDEPCKTKPAIDLVSAVEEFHKLSSRDLSKLISEADDGIIRHTKDDGSLLEINMESLITNLALHLISKLLSSKRDEQHLRYLLSGIRLLHGLSNISSRHPKLEKFLFNDMKLFDRILDLVFFITIFLSNFKQKLSPPILPPSLLASSLYLLKIYISQEWHELATIILVHPKGDVFISAVCPAVRVVIGFLQVKLSDTHIISNVDEVNRVCLDCEASLQFLGSLCNILKFRESHVNNKELFADGGVLLLVRDIMKLPQCEDSNLMDAVSRLKSKVLSIMLQICEIESISFLDLAASTTQGLDFAKSALSEVLKMLKIMFSGNVNGFKPRGIMHHVAMTLTEIFSDETNFRSYIVSNFTEVLTREFLLPHGKFLSTWCSSNSELVEKDVILNYDSFSASGLALDVMSASRGSKSSFTTPPPSYTPFAYQKTSLLVKIIANLTCFVPDVCKEERGAFVNKFFKCLQKELSNSQDGVEHAARNLRSLLGHAGSLTPGFLHEDDVTFLRLFVRQLEKLITPKENNIIQVKEVDNRGKSSSPEGSGERGGDESEGDDNNNIETIGSYLSNMQLKSSDQINKNNDDEVPEEETHQLVRKRKRNLMNDVQMGIIQNALQDDPHMQRRPATIQLWADKLSRHGSEITSSQLKNWLNNRKAKIAREAAKHAVVASSGESDALTLTLTLTDKQDDHVSDSNSPSPAADDSSRKDDVCEETKTQSVTVTVTGTGTEEETVSVPRGTSDFKRQAGQYVVLIDEKGDEIGKGRIHLAKGTWFDTNLQECGLCVVDVNDLKVDDTTLLPHPCDVTGTTFRQAQQILNRKRVLWESNKLLLIQQLPN